jgi:DNA/RNA endonuclease YhcR with UshA esterase domain
MMMKQGVLAVGLALLGTTVPLAAHHSFSTEYDQNKPVTLTGVVTKVEWTNPHARFYIDVKDDNGTVTNWNFELASANSLRRNGWTKTTLKIGDKITAKGFAALSGVKMANANSVTLADGTALFAATDAPSVQQAPQK